MLSLVIDASSSLLQVGLLDETQWLCYECEQTSVTQYLVYAIKKCLSEKKLSLNNLDRIMVCQGPGSTLGVRLSEMLVTTFQSNYSTLSKIPCIYYNSLILSSFIFFDNPDHQEKPFYMIAPAADKKWHLAKKQKATDPLITEIVNLELLHNKTQTTHLLYYLPLRKIDSALPKNIQAFPYKLLAYPHLFNLPMDESCVIKEMTQSTFTLWQP